MKKFEMTFNYLDTDNKTVRGYDVHPLYDEIKNCFNSYLGSPVDRRKEKYIEKHIDFEGKEIKFDMERYTLTYSVAWNEIAHLNSMIKLLENLDLDLTYELKED